MALDHFPRPLKGVPGILDVPLRLQVFHPGHPLLHLLLHLLGARWPLCVPVQIDKLAHCHSPLVCVGLRIYDVRGHAGRTFFYSLFRLPLMLPRVQNAVAFRSSEFFAPSASMGSRRTSNILASTSFRKRTSPSMYVR